MPQRKFRINKTTLLGYLELCKNYSFARRLLYSEVPANFIWKNDKFSRRKQGKGDSGLPGVKQDHVMIGRVHTVTLTTPNAITNDSYFMKCVDRLALMISK